MKFCIALVTYWKDHGFDCTDWRKSTDGTQSIVHLEYAKKLIPNIENDNNVTIYECPSDVLTNLLNSTSWTTTNS